ncbi:MAG: sigma-70 family RNA polymerase sigma factor [Phycisphaerales bacterium]|nr:sigma-70 family RNA polymerase sigma factor [Phycisphaerales bacterium]
MSAFVPPLHLTPSMAAARGAEAVVSAATRIRDWSLATARRPEAKPVSRETDVAERTDEQLLTDSIGGDRDAFAALVDRYRNDLLHFLIRFLGTRAAAEDVFQDTFLQIHLSARTFDPERRFKPWLFTIAANKARDYHRRNLRRAPLSLSAAAPTADGEGDAFVDLMAADIPSPDAPITDVERSDLVREVMDAMPSHYREILLLSYFQRMSYNQIAECLEIPLGTVKSRLHAAVARFAEGWRTSRAKLDHTP